MAKNLELDQGRVVLNPRTPAWWVAAVYTVVYLGVLCEGAKELARAVGEGRGMLPALLLLLAITVIWLFLMRNFGSRIIFDPSSRKVYKKTLVGHKELMGFEDIAEIAPVEESSQNCAVTSTYFKIAPKGDRFGKGVRLTTSFTAKDRDKFIEEELPSLARILDLGTAAPASGAPTDEARDAGAVSPPENPRRYRKNGEMYTLPFRLRILVLIVAALVCFAVAPGIDEPNVGYLVAGIGAALLLLAFFSQTRLTLDRSSRTITLVTGFGLLKKTNSFDDFEGLSVNRETLNFIPSGTYLFMNVAGRKAPILLAKTYLFTKKLNAVGEETMRILGIDSTWKNPSSQLPRQDTDMEEDASPAG